MKPGKLLALINSFCIVLSTAAFSQTRVIDAHVYHLRSSDNIEWKDVKGIPQKKLLLHFSASQISSDQVLALYQQDVKQKWTVQLNDMMLGNLQQDENSMLTYFSIPAAALKNGKNELLIQQADTTADDIRIGEIKLISKPVNEFLNEATIEISVTDRSSKKLIPARLTLVDRKHALQPIATRNDTLLAIRTGVIYTGSGKALFNIPEGTYILYANHGFQYGADSVKLIVKRGDKIKRTISIEKEVPLEGWISSDTHIHTLTYSGHGDASMRERIITLAGEGIEFPIITEHNRCINIDSLSKALNLRQYFTPVAGNEYTTAVGHFNIFPLKADSIVPDYHVNDWNAVVHNLAAGNSKHAIILNHAQDIHNGFRPFDPVRHVSVSGMELDGWPFPANSMEVVNSGAQRFDIMQLYNDWFGMMNRGNYLTPVGSSDSHDVSRYIVGQARTYIRYNGKDPANIDIPNATNHFLDGEVMVSFGLITEMNIDGKYGPGSLVPAAKQVRASVKVMGPMWAIADSIFLFANGQKIRSEKIDSKPVKGVKWQKTWTIPVTNQDVFLVAIATGPDPAKPFWPIAKPYQPTSTEWTARIIGSSGAIWIDGDGDGKRTSAHDYAVKLLTNFDNDFPSLLNQLAAYDEAVSVQAASLLYEQHRLPGSADMESILRNSKPAVKRGFMLFLDELNKSKPAR